MGSMGIVCTASGVGSAWTPHTRMLALVLVVATTLSLLMAGCSPSGSRSPSVAISDDILTGESDVLGFSLRFPVLTSGDDAEQAILSSFTESLKDSSLALLDELSGKATEDQAGAQIGGYTFRRHMYEMDFQVTYNRDHLLSLTTDEYFYTGGAHGLTVRTSHNLDLATGETLTLEDLFKHDTDFKTVLREEIARRVLADPDRYFPEASDALEIADDQGFYLADGALFIHYSVYHIAPYATGIPEFRFGLEELGSILKPKYKESLANHNELEQGLAFQIRSMDVLSNTPDSVTVVLRTVSAGGAWDLPVHDVKVLGENEPLFIGEGKAKDDTLSKSRVELLLTDTTMQKAVREEYGLTTKTVAGTHGQGGGGGGEGGLLKAIRVAYPPDDALMAIYFGCESEPVVSVVKNYGEIVVTLTRAK